MPASLQGEMILIIDDDECIRDSCRQALTRAGYYVETAVNGEAGLTKAVEIVPDLAIVDLQMPGISGLELMDQLERVSPQTIRIMVTGAKTSDLVTEIIRKDRAMGCLFKPFTPDELILVVKEAFDSRQIQEQ